MKANTFKNEHDICFCGGGMKLGVKLWNAVKGLRLQCVAEAYGTFETEWSGRVVVERGTKGTKPCNVMESKKGHVPQANSQ